MKDLHCRTWLSCLHMESFLFCSGHLGSPAGKSLVVVKLPTLEWTPYHWFSCLRADRGSTNQSTQRAQMKCEPMTPHVFQESVHAALITTWMKNQVNYISLSLLGKVLLDVKSCTGNTYCSQCTCTWHLLEYRYICR